MSMRNFANRSLTLALLVASAAAHSQNPPAILKIDTGNAVSKVSPELYGLMTEEINYSYDGGLYAELIRNRTFRADWGGVQHWYLVQEGTSHASMEADKAIGPSAALTNSIKLTVDKADASSRAGIENEGYWGILVKPNDEYKGSFYAKSDGSAAVSVQLINDDTGKIAAQAEVSGNHQRLEEI